MDKNSFVLKGDIAFSQSKTNIKTQKSGFLVCVDGICQGVFSDLPDEYKHLRFIDYSGKLILPGLVDLHVHAPQFYSRGLGMDMELLDWLNTYTFPQEAKYKDIKYAEKTYKKFVEDVKNGPNTRCVVFATIHPDSTIILMDILEQSGLISYVGKVNMDRNSSEELQEKSAVISKEDTIKWIDKVKDKYKNTYPIITPRFTPSCSDELMDYLGKIQKEYKLKVQSHLSENQGEIEWVKQLCSDVDFYAQSYSKYGLFGGENCDTIMAHCVWSGEDEQKLIKDKGVFIAHCPNSNCNLASGIAPIKKYINDNQKIGLGSDVAGGTHTSIFKSMADAIIVSKLYWRLVNNELLPLTVSEAFYLGTVGGGEFFGKVGSFDKGYECDIIIVDDSRFNEISDYWNINQRLERTIYLCDNEDISHKFVRGHQLY